MEQSYKPIKRIFTVLFIASAAASLGIFIVIPILPIFAQDLGASGFAVGLVISSFAISKSLINPFIGRLSDKLGKKLPIASGLALFTIVALMFSFAGNALELIGIRLLMGAANAMVVPIIGAYIGELTKEGNEATYMAVFNISTMIGIGLGPIAGGIISGKLGTTATFYAMAASTFIAFLLIVFFLPENSYSRKFSEAKENPFKKFWAIPQLKGLIVYNIINSLGMGGIIGFLPILTKKNNLSTVQIGILLSSILIVTGILQIPFGRYADRKGNKGAFVIFGAIIYIIALIALPYAPGFWGFLMIGIFSAIGTAIAGPAVNALVIENCREIGLGFSVAVMDTATTVGFIVGPLLSGLVMDILGIESVFLVCALAYIFGLWIFFRKCYMISINRIIK